MLIISQLSVAACSTTYFLFGGVFLVFRKKFMGHLLLLIIQFMQVAATVLSTKEESGHTLLIFY